MKTQRKAKTQAWTPKVGDGVAIRAVTYHQIGRVAAIDEDWISLTEAAWLADSRRFGASMRNGLPDDAEIEYVGTCCVARGAIVDVWPYNHELPKADR